MKKIYILVFSLLASIYLYAEENTQSGDDLYMQIIEYYDLALEAHANGDYIQSFEYTELANQIFDEADIELYIQVASRLLADLERSVSNSISNFGTGESVSNYNTIVEVYNTAKSEHDTFLTYTPSDNATEIKSTFESSRNYYRTARSLIDIAIAGGSSADNVNRGNTQSLIEEANTKYDYLTKNRILTSRDSDYKTLTDNIGKMNKENSSNLANENIKMMNEMIIENDVQKMIDYADRAMKKAGRDITSNEAYQNTVDMVEEGKNLYANKDYRNSADNLSKALLAMESQFSLLKKLPKTYTVIKRSSPTLTDSFWVIAGNDFIYADHQKWENLYEANKDKVKYEGNPRVILPSVVLDVTSIINEPREGHYNPNELYLPITVYYYLNTSSRAQNNYKPTAVSTNRSYSNVITDNDVVDSQNSSGITVESFSDTDTTDISNQPNANEYKQ